MQGEVDVVDFLRIFHGARHVHVVKIQRVAIALLLELCEIQIVVLVMARVNVRHANGHRTVHIHGQLRNPLRIVQLAQVIHQRLRASHGEGGNHHHAAALGHAIDHVRQLIRHGAGAVLAIAVGGFAQQEIRARRAAPGSFRIDLIVAADVAGENHQSLLAVFGDGQFQPCGTQNVPGIVRAHGKFRADGEIILARNFLESRQGLLRLRHGVKRQRLFVAAVTFARGELRVFFLQVRGIGQQQIAQLVRRGIGIDRTAITRRPPGAAGSPCDQCARALAAPNQSSRDPP